jgi:anti-sigma factor RsiW
MADLGRVVAGVACREVLAELSAWMDGELDAVRAAALAAHVQGCDQCERFGGQFGAVLRRFRAELAAPAPVEAGVAARLRERLRRERAAG